MCPITNTMIFSELISVHSCIQIPRKYNKKIIILLLFLYFYWFTSHSTFIDANIYTKRIESKVVKEILKKLRSKKSQARTLYIEIV